MLSRNTCQTSGFVSISVCFELNLISWYICTGVCKSRSSAHAPPSQSDGGPVRHLPSKIWSCWIRSTTTCQQLVNLSERCSVHIMLVQDGTSRHVTELICLEKLSWMRLSVVGTLSCRFKSYLYLNQSLKRPSRHQSQLLFLTLQCLKSNH